MKDLCLRHVQLLDISMDQIMEIIKFVHLGRRFAIARGTNDLWTSKIAQSPIGRIL